MALLPRTYKRNWAKIVQNIYHMEAAYSIQNMGDPISINVVTAGTSGI